MKISNLAHGVLTFVVCCTGTTAFQLSSRSASTIVSSTRKFSISNDDNNSNFMATSIPVQIMLMGAIFAAEPAASNAYSKSDYVSEAVIEAVTQLRESSGDAAKTFSVFEEVQKIITEGKGVGGSVNYAGVSLQRGEIADEDTSIYNPGLTLLTESEKERLVEAIVQNKEKALATKTWNDNNQYAFEYLKTNLDPLHVYELRPYLSIFPIYAAGVYVLTLLVQQVARSLFEAAYIFGALAVFVPAILLILSGP